jgi:polyribonucleotide 5'-hydroxyl-kinase
MDEEDGLYGSGESIFEKETPSMLMQGSLLAVMHADPTESHQNIRDSSVMGYVYVAEVQEEKHKIRLLAPVSGRIPPKAMIWGSWPEDSADLVG